MKKLKYRKILSIIGNLVLMFLILIGALVAISLLPIRNNYKILAVTSGSMEPTIGVGSLAIVKPAGEYKIGDIITFKRPNATSDKDATTHRITKIIEQGKNKFYETKGDANDTVDMVPVSSDQVIGKYRFSIALLGYLLKYIKTLPGLILIIVIPATVIIYEEGRKIGRELKRIKLAKKGKLNIAPKKRRKNGKISK